MQNHRTRRLGSKLGITAAALLLFTGILSVTAMGLFTDSDAVPANVFTTGSVSLTTSPTTGVVTFTGMVPGDQVTAPLTVTNNGSAALRYAVTSSTTENVLATQLALTVKTGVATCTTAGFAATGTVVYGPAALGNTVPLAIIGNTAQGAQAGDRTLAPAGERGPLLQREPARWPRGTHSRTWRRRRPSRLRPSRRPTTRDRSDRRPEHSGVSRRGTHHPGRRPRRSGRARRDRRDRPRRSRARRRRPTVRRRDRRDVRREHG